MQTKWGSTLGNRYSRRQMARSEARGPSKDEIAIDQQWEQLDVGRRSGVDSQISQVAPHALTVLTNVDGQRVTRYAQLQDAAVSALIAVFNLRQRQAEAMPVGDVEEPEPTVDEA